MSYKKISVIVTSYNYEQFIGKTIESLLNQTIKDFEIIVIDDGSSDASVDVIRSYNSSHPELKFIQHPDKKNHGLAASVKLAIEHCAGEFIAFCESDDYWHEEHIEKLLEFIKCNPNASLIFNELIVINNSSNKEYTQYVAHSNQFLKSNSGKNIFPHLTSNPMPTFSSACIRRSLLTQCDFNSFIRPYLDFWLWRQLCLLHPIYFVEECITYWRKHDQSYDMKEGVRNIGDFLIASNNLLITQSMHHITWFDKIILKIKKIFRKRSYVKGQIKILNKFAKKG